MKKSIIVVITLLALSSCMSMAFEEPKGKLPEEYKGMYLQIDENKGSDDFGSISLIMIKETPEDKRSYTSQVLFSTGYLEEAPLVIDAYQYDGYTKGRGKLNPDSNDLFLFYFYKDKFTDDLPANDFINYENTAGVMHYIEIVIYHDNERFYKVNGIKSFDDIKKIENKYLQFHKEMEEKEEIKEEQDRIANEKIIENSKNYYIKKYNAKTVYIAALGAYQMWWSEPQPFVGELMSDGESIRFISTEGNFMAKETVFLLTWDDSLLGKFASMTSSYMSENSDLLFPNIIMNGDKRFSYIENSDVTSNLKNILLTFDLRANKTVFLIDLKNYDTGQSFYSMMTGGYQDGDASFYFIAE